MNPGSKNFLLLQISVTIQRGTQPAFWGDLGKKEEFIVIFDF